MDKRPHIVIFNPDQWRWDVMGHMDNPAAVTPNLDRFADEGFVLSSAAANYPVCSPSRAMLMTVSVASGWRSPVLIKLRMCSPGSSAWKLLLTP